MKDLIPLTVSGAYDAEDMYAYYFNEYPSKYVHHWNKDGRCINKNVFEQILSFFDTPVKIFEFSGTYDYHKNQKVEHQLPTNKYVFGDRLVIDVGVNVLVFCYDNKVFSKIKFDNIVEKCETNPDLWEKIDKTNTISFINQDQNGISLIDFESKNKNNVDLQLNYNDDFPLINLKIQNFIKENKNGLILLHSEPGCGKSYYIRYLINNSGGKQFVYIPPNMTNVISEPSFINFAIKNLNNCVLVIEDAENVIEQRRGQDNQAVSNLLNLADGLMSDVLNIQVICTFNKAIDKIDDALLRKGRLLLRYKFEKLDTLKANALLENLGRDCRTTEPMSLAEIYNEDENNGNIEHKHKIGFK